MWIERENYGNTTYVITVDHELIATIWYASIAGAIFALLVMTFLFAICARSFIRAAIVRNQRSKWWNPEPKCAKDV